MLEIPTMPQPTSSAAIELLRERLNRVLLGKRDKIELVLACCSPRATCCSTTCGLGQDHLSQSGRSRIWCKFARVQCTPDLLPTDITGFNLFNQKTREFEFQCRPCFLDILLADEINRTTLARRAPLFEAMAERQVTIDGLSRPLHRLSS